MPSQLAFLTPPPDPVPMNTTFSNVIYFVRIAPVATRIEKMRLFVAVVTLLGISIMLYVYDRESANLAKNIRLCFRIMVKLFQRNFTLLARETIL